MINWLDKRIMERLNVVITVIYHNLVTDKIWHASHILLFMQKAMIEVVNLLGRWRKLHMAIRGRKDAVNDWPGHCHLYCTTIQDWLFFIKHLQRTYIYISRMLWWTFWLLRHYVSWASSFPSCHRQAYPLMTCSDCILNVDGILNS